MMLAKSVRLWRSRRRKRISHAAIPGREILPANALFITDYADSAVAANGHIDPVMEIITNAFGWRAR
jgi:hypothetical protein